MPLLDLTGADPWTPAEITTEGWWDFSDTATITDSGGKVSQVDDKSGNARHFLQANGTRQMTTGASTINALNVIDGLEDSTCMETNAFTWLGDFQIFCVFESTNNVNTGHTPYTIDNQFRFLGDNASFFRGELRSIGTQTFTDKNYVNADHDGPAFWSQTFDFSSNNIKGYYNGNEQVDITDYNTSINTSRIWLLNTRSDGPAIDGLNGSFGEIVVTPAGADRQTMEGYLAWKWGLQASLPGGHPYEFGAPTL